MKKVLVTGGAGFIGSRLALRLIHRGCAVTVLDDLSTGSAKAVAAGAVFIQHDITEPLPELPPFDTCFHLAAISRIGLCAKNPTRTQAVNVRGTLRLLARAANLKAKLVFASSCTAAEPERNEYAASKHAAERFCSADAREMGAAVAVARLFNVYGPGEPADGPTATLVARFLAQRKQGALLTIHGDGFQRRDFVHVDDAIDALLILATSETDPTPHDVGTGATLSVIEVANLLRHPTTHLDAPQTSEMPTARADPARMKALGWQPVWTLPEYLAEAPV